LPRSNLIDSTGWRTKRRESRLTEIGRRLANTVPAAFGFAFSPPLFRPSGGLVADFSRFLRT
jgi:hypothetical protein